MTKSSKGEMIVGGGHFDPHYEQPLYIKDLADWLDGTAPGHPCDGDISYHGFEAAMALFISSLDQRRYSSRTPEAAMQIRTGVERDWRERPKWFQSTGSNALSTASTRTLAEKGLCSRATHPSSVAAFSVD